VTRTQRGPSVAELAQLTEARASGDSTEAVQPNEPSGFRLCLSPERAIPFYPTLWLARTESSNPCRVRAVLPTVGGFGLPGVLLANEPHA